ncbi:hypothetical protein HJC23_013616 [Cyclotella cryptica]|uniref:Uncharacterized protein n=1 Tax=Cyclotella cryptica TaxID=29204 RepID=A0ABD3PPK4_9STRA
MKNTSAYKQINHRQSTIAQSSPDKSYDQLLSQPHQHQQHEVFFPSNQVDIQVQHQGCVHFEQWCQQVTTMDCKEKSVCSSISCKIVSFSPHSCLHIYTSSEDERFKSYSSSQRELFQAQALYDAFQIQKLIEACPYKGGAAIRHLIEHNLVGTEELLGIESLIIGGGKTSKDRRVHSRYVLKTQSDLKNKKVVNIGQKLADVATVRSLKSVEMALLRAVLAA